MSDTAEALTGRRVLVVEDDYMLAQEVVRVLRRAGAEVVGPYPSVADALAYFHDGPPQVDAAVLDVQLRGGERVYPVAERLAQLGIRFLFATGSNPGLERTVYADRPTLAKPITGRMLIKAVGRLLEGD